MFLPPHTSHCRHHTHITHIKHTHFPAPTHPQPQALKANPESACKELKLNNNYITRFGQVALTEAVDMVYEMGGGNMLTVTF